MPSIPRELVRHVTKYTHSFTHLLPHALTTNNFFIVIDSPSSKVRASCFHGCFKLLENVMWRGDPPCRILRLLHPRHPQLQNHVPRTPTWHSMEEWTIFEHLMHQRNQTSKCALFGCCPRSCTGVKSNCKSILGYFCIRSAIYNSRPMKCRLRYFLF